MTAGDPPKIAQPYLLVLFSVPFYLDARGRRYLEPLWAKDLVEHTRYIERLVLAAPAMRDEMPANAVAIDAVPALGGVTFVELPPAHSYLDAVRKLPRTWRTLWAASNGVALVHSGVASWPLPEAWVLAPILALRRCIHYINVESAFWRLVPGERVGLKRRLQSAVTERLNRWCVGAADISTFTQDGYRRSLLRRHPERGHVVEASWIDAGAILTPAQLALARQAREQGGALRLVFAGRLTAGKGVRLLMDAARGAIANGADIELDVFGDGPLADECGELLQREPTLAARVRMRGSVPYDAGFFELLGGFHLLVVPTLTDEQPRIVFDAYSQGLPVLGSDTSGMVQCVADGVTGVLFRSGDAAALQAAIEVVAHDPAALVAMADACAARARALTHQEMHRKRWRLLVEAFPGLAVR